MVLLPASMPQQTMPWDGWRPASCMPAHCFCEQVRDGIVAQPANAASSLAFVLVGAWVARMAWRDRRAGRESLPAGNGAYAWIYAGACIVVATGSAFYHASLTFAGQLADVFGMYLLGSFVLLYGLARERTVSPAVLLGSYVLLNALLLLPLYFAPGTRRWLFALLIVSAVAAEVLARRRSRLAYRGAYLRWAVGALGAGFALWVLDITRAVCWPRAPIQGHAVWHLAGAFASASIYLYYRSARPPPPPQPAG